MKNLRELGVKKESVCSGSSLLFVMTISAKNNDVERTRIVRMMTFKILSRPTYGTFLTR